MDGWIVGLLVSSSSEAFPRSGVAWRGVAWRPPRHLALVVTRSLASNVPRAAQPSVALSVSRSCSLDNKSARGGCCEARMYQPPRKWTTTATTKIGPQNRH
jgi:hypothetical protein